MNTKKSPTVVWLFSAVVIVLTIINAALTWQFGSLYFAAAFSIGVLGTFMAGFYSLLIFDVAYITWFYTYLRGSHGKWQRALSLLMAILALGGSIMATVNQLVVNSFGLVDLTEYQDAVGFVALGTMIVITALHIIAFAGFILLDPKERVKTEGANILSEVIEDALLEMRNRLNADKTVLVDQISADYRVEMLTALGFTRDLKFVGRPDEEEAPALPASSDGSTTKKKVLPYVTLDLPDGSSSNWYGHLPHRAPFSVKARLMPLPDGTYRDLYAGFADLEDAQYAAQILSEGYFDSNLECFVYERDEDYHWSIIEKWRHGHVADTTEPSDDTQRPFSEELAHEDTNFPNGNGHSHKA